ncbi:hypothetical protein C0075_13365 [Rhizobium sp. KAs_5_22]|uniref:hypothetical protein n=1 Tax=Ciceribacter selenitireducens TaxID=448181 RepID=UPI00048EB09D|nr:hypothetical protein [Ciceribacter selenitireducens]PPJ46637.1 hypothetical protein C0075_13365 [Rhizobium sp. KAs_5_22]
MSQARGGSPFGLLIAILVSLVLGGAAGYGAMRYLGPQDADRLATVDQQIADLSAQLNDSNRRLAEAVEGRKRAETALDAGDPATAALRQTLDSQRGELDSMADTLEATSRELLSEKEENARLAKALAEARQQSLAQDKAIENARQEATSAKASADAALADLRQRLEASEGEAGQSLAQLKTEEIPRLEAQIAALADKLAKAEADGTKISAERDALGAQLARSRDVLKNAEDMLARERERSAGLQAELDAARADSAPGEDAAPDSPPSAPPETAEDLPLIANAPRDPAAVDAVLARTPGLDRLSAEDYQRLRSLLVSGECVTTGLQSVFRSVPVVTLRNLMRDLKSGC